MQTLEQASKWGRIAATVFLLDAVALGQVIHVDVDVSGGSGDGSTWPNAMPSLQDGIDEVAANGGRIIVAEGTYTPEELWDGTSTGTDPLEATFLLKGDSDLHGGFLGGLGSSSNPDAPDGRYASTVLDGDLGGGDFSYHVIFIDEDLISSEVTIDGFRITNGRANGSSSLHRRGAGIVTEGDTKVVLENLTIDQNVAKDEGGGVYMEGGGVDISFTCKLSQFSNNVATHGAGLFLGFNFPVADLVNVRFLSNGSDEEDVSGFPPQTETGGAIRVGSELPFRFTNCLIHDNVANQGGAIFYDPSIPTGLLRFDPFIKSCTITRNMALGGTNASGGIHVAPGSPQTSTTGHFLVVRNSIVWGNHRMAVPPVAADLSVLGISNMEGITVDVDYTDLGASVDTTLSPADGLTVDASCISLDPRFVAPSSDNFRLSLDDPAGISPCIDEGEDSLLDDDWLDVNENFVVELVIPWDFGRTARVVNNTTFVGQSDLDMGAYEAPDGP